MSDSGHTQTPPPDAALPGFEPCIHATPQGADQLHGICVFCYRDRLGASRTHLAALTAQNVALTAQNAAQAREIERLQDRRPFFLVDPNTGDVQECIPDRLKNEARAAGFVGGLRKAVAIAVAYHEREFWDLDLEKVVGLIEAEIERRKEQT